MNMISISEYVLLSVLRSLCGGRKTLPRFSVYSSEIITFSGLWSCGADTFLQASRVSVYLFVPRNTVLEMLHFSLFLMNRLQTIFLYLQRFLHFRIFYDLNTCRGRPYNVAPYADTVLM